VLKNIASNWLLLAASVLVVYTLLPFNLHALGQESYGIWLLVVSLSGYLYLMNLGIPMASVQFLLAGRNSVG
jgi:hypothetical protein